MTRGRKATHQWRLWLDGRTHLLRRGEDFACKPRAFQCRAQSHASYHGMTVRTRLLGTGEVVEIRRVERADERADHQ